MSKVYVTGSMRNPKVIEVANTLEAAGHRVFDDWIAPGDLADEKWREYELARGRDYITALQGPHVDNIFNFDKRWLDWAEVGVMVMPAGKSAFAELGYLRGTGKFTIVLMQEEDPERWDIMLRFAHVFARTAQEVLDAIAANKRLAS